MFKKNDTEKYALLTVTDNKNVIKKYDWINFYNNEFINTESRLGNSSLSITVYNIYEKDSLWNTLSFLDKKTCRIYLLEDMLDKKREAK